MENFNGEGSTWDGEDRSVAVKVGEFLGVHRGRSDNQFEVSPTREDCILERTERMR